MRGAGRNRVRLSDLLLILVAGFAVVGPISVPLHGQAAAPASVSTPPKASQPAVTVPDTEWRTYGGDLRSTRYIPLDQINRGNFSKLEVAWRLKTDAFGPRPEFNFQSTPLVVGGVLYTTAGSRRAVVALDAETGEL